MAQCCDPQHDHTCINNDTKSKTELQVNEIRSRGVGFDSAHSLLVSPCVFSF